MDGLTYSASAVTADAGMVEIVGNQANLWLREQTTLTVPAGSTETANEYAADRAFIFVRTGTTWALADERMLSQGPLAPLTEPLSEFTSVTPVEVSSGEPAPAPGAENNYNFGSDETTPNTGTSVENNPPESTIDGTDPTPDGTTKTDGPTPTGTTTTALYNGDSPSGFTTAMLSTTGNASGQVRLASIPANLCYACMVNYARKYVFNYNKSYRNYHTKGGDCTNFVSQALRAGGWKDDYGWYTSSDNWWYNSLNQTYTWGGAENWSRFAPKRTIALSSVWKAQAGDVIQADWDANGTMDHTFIVTKVSPYEVYTTAHENDNLDKPFSRIIREVKAAHPKTKYYAYRT
jgi:hypothetical protein